MGMLSVRSLHLLLCFAFLCQLVLSQQQWDASNYPSPMANFQQCGMKASSYICDPDNILSVNDRYHINHELQQLETRTRQSGGATHCAQKGITAAMAISRRIRGGSSAAREMANKLLQRWRIDDQCHKAIVFVVAIEDRAFWAARDDQVPVYAQEIDQIFASQKQYFQNGQISQALRNIIQGIWNSAISKQGQPSMSGSGTPFRPQPQPQPQPFPNDRDRGKGSGSGSSLFGWFSSMSTLTKIALFIIVFFLLLCCCCCYCLCCRGRGGDGRSQVPTDPGYAEGGGSGGGGLFGRFGGGGGGGGLNNFLGSLGGAGIGSMIGRFMSNRGGGGGGGGMPMGNTGGYMGGGGNSDYQGGGAYPAGPQPVYDDRGGEGGGGLYPSKSVKDEGGGGTW